MGILLSKNYCSRIMARNILKTLWHQDFQNLAKAYPKTQLLVVFGLVSLPHMILKVMMI